MTIFTADILLAKHYGFTEEELDFIINYDIKYRMGNAPEGEARREGSSEAKNGEAARKGPHELNAGERKERRRKMKAENQFSRPHLAESRPSGARQCATRDGNLHFMKLLERRLK